MFNKILSFVVLSVFFIACSDDSSVNEPFPEDDIVESSSSVQKQSSSSRKTETVYDTLYVKDSITVPYYKEDSSAFSWDDVLSSSAKQEISSSSTKQSSASVQSSSSAAGSQIMGAGTLIDGRDKKEYKLVQVGQVIWMAENLNYASENSVCYEDLEDCSKGRLYFHSELENICPTGFSLPTREAFLNVASDDSFVWSFGGRKKADDYSFYDEMGFFWLDTEETAEDSDEINCSTDSCAMIFVQKSKEYDGIGEYLFQSDNTTKAFSVRCVTVLK